jgi:hypothetical protein
MYKFSRIISLFLIACLAPFLHAQSEFSGVERIVAVGDVHGDYDEFVRVLREAELINRRRNWIAGETHFVQVGDLPDRGPDTDKIIELMKKLEQQAEEEGGKVHALIGNHEAMNMLGDLRYVDPGEYAAFRSSRSRQYRDNYYAQVLQQQLAADPEFEASPEFRQEFEARFPLGYVEHRLAWAPAGEIGSWVLEHNAVVKIDRYLFLHAGLSPAVLGMPLEDINQQIRHELAGNLGEEPGLSEADDGPLWYRGLAQNDEATEMAHVDELLAFYDVDHIVLGHTPGTGVILPRFEGKVLIVDTGLSSYYGAHGASLLIEGDEILAHQGGEQYRIPQGESPLQYLQEVAARKADAPAALQRLIDQLGAPAN